MSDIAESTLVDLYNSAVAAFPNTRFRQHATQPIKIVNIGWTPYLGLKTLFVKGLAQNEEREYTPLILIKGMMYNSNPDVKLVASDGLLYEFKKPSLAENEVLVRCNCPDFRWRFSYYNHLDRSLFGRKPRKYESKGGQPANPLQLEGMCKHIMKLVQALVDAGVID